MLEWVIWTIVGVFFLGCLTDFYGLGALFRGRKDAWVKIKYSDFPVIMQKLEKARAFSDCDGINCESIKMTVQWLNGSPYYKIRIPGHVFHNVEYKMILEELGIS